MQGWHIVLINSVFCVAVLAANCLLTWYLVMSGQPAPSTKGRFAYCIFFGLQATLMLKLARYIDSNGWAIGILVVGVLIPTFAVSILSFTIHDWYGTTAGITTLLTWSLLLSTFIPACFPPREVES